MRSVPAPRSQKPVSANLRRNSDSDRTPSGKHAPRLRMSKCAAMNAGSSASRNRTQRDTLAAQHHQLQSKTIPRSGPVTATRVPPKTPRSYCLPCLNLAPIQVSLASVRCDVNRTVAFALIRPRRSTVAPDEEIRTRVLPRTHPVGALWTEQLGRQPVFVRGGVGDLHADEVGEVRTSGAVR
jgi:hypothetical protein